MFICPVLAISDYRSSCRHCNPVTSWGVFQTTILYHCTTHYLIWAVFFGESTAALMSSEVSDTCKFWWLVIWDVWRFDCFFSKGQSWTLRISQSEIKIKSNLPDSETSGNSAIRSLKRFQIPNGLQSPFGCFLQRRHPLMFTDITDGFAILCLVQCLKVRFHGFVCPAADIALGL